MTIISRREFTGGNYGIPFPWDFEVSQNDWNNWNDIYNSNVYIEFELYYTGGAIPYTMSAPSDNWVKKIELVIDSGKYYIRLVWFQGWGGFPFVISEVTDLIITSTPSFEIIQQPTNNKIKAAYRPIVFKVEYLNNPPVVYCDIYFNNIYYKSLSKTNPQLDNIYLFDISDACQEYLKSELAPINGTNANIPENYYTDVYCKFRTSVIDIWRGFITPQEIIPIQGTYNSEPIAGSGLQSNTFYVINAVLQHENNQDLESHLQTFSQNNTILELTHRPEKYKICKDDSDYFSIVNKDLSEITSVQITLNKKDGNQQIVIINSGFAGTVGLIQDLPNGPKNFPSVDFSQVIDYILEYEFTSGDTLQIQNQISCCCNDDKLRIHFINYLGRVDAINFNHKEETLEVKSEKWHKSLNFPLVKSDGGVRRLNVKSNETYKAINNCYSEQDMQWIKELFTSPLAWIEWKGIEGQNDDYLPIFVTDKKVITRKKEGRYFYEIQIEFSMSNENIHIRN